MKSTLFVHVKEMFSVCLRSRSVAGTGGGLLVLASRVAYQTNALS